MIKRKPDVEITHQDGTPYLRRWWIIPKNRFFNIYLHHFLSSDEDRALHDHPWWSIGMIISKGLYWEYMPDTRTRVIRILYADDKIQHTDTGKTLWDMYRSTRAELRRRFQPVLRRASHIHRVELIKDSEGKEIPVWTIFITGPKIREWGFWCPKGFVIWHKFVKKTDNGNTVGLGCNDE